MKSSPSEYQFVFCGHENLANGKYTQDYIDEMSAQSNRYWTNQARQMTSVISQGQVEKPEWFREQERSARRFVDSLGLVAARGTQITIVDPRTTKIAKAAFPWDEPNFKAKAMHWPRNGILIRNTIVDLAEAKTEPEAVGKILAHELVHAAEYCDTNYYQQYHKKSKKWRAHHRSGFSTKRADETERGMFYDEAVAEYVAGLYTRRLDDPQSELVSIDDEPSSDLPAHYTDYVVSLGNPPVAGPDGYSIEMLAWGAEQKGVCSRDDFIAAALGTYSLDKTVRLASYRHFARAIDAVQPGLYPHLRDLKYGRESWREAQKTVYEALQS